MRHWWQMHCSSQSERMPAHFHAPVLKRLRGMVQLSKASSGCTARLTNIDCRWIYRVGGAEHQPQGRHSASKMPEQCHAGVGALLSPMFLLCPTSAHAQLSSHSAAQLSLGAPCTQRELQACTHTRYRHVPRRICWLLPAHAPDAQQQQPCRSSMSRPMQGQACWLQGAQECQPARRGRGPAYAHEEGRGGPGEVGCAQRHRPHRGILRQEKERHRVHPQGEVACRLACSSCRPLP